MKSISELALRQALMGHDAIPMRQKVFPRGLEHRMNV